MLFLHFANINLWQWKHFLWCFNIRHTAAILSSSYIYIQEEQLCPSSLFFFIFFFPPNLKRYMSLGVKYIFMQISFADALFPATLPPIYLWILLWFLVFIKGNKNILLNWKWQCGWKAIYQHWVLSVWQHSFALSLPAMTHISLSVLWRGGVQNDALAWKILFEDTC